MRSPFAILKSQFVRDSGTLLSGNVIAQGVAFLAYLVLCRLFSPEDFGLYNIFYSYIEVLIILSTCKYELSIVVADTDEEASAMTRLSLRLNAAVSLLLIGVALLLAWTEPGWIKLPPWLLLLVPLLVYFCGTTRVYTFACNRYKQYRTIASSEVVTSVGGVLAKAAFGLLSRTAELLHTWGLPLGTILGKVAGNIYYRIQLRKMTPALPAAKPTWELARKHRNFPLFVTMKDFLSSLSANLPFLWLGVYFDSAVIGLFALAVTFTMRPVNILNNAFEKVFYASSAEKVHARQAIGPDIRRFLLILNAAAIPVVVLGFFVAEPLFTWLMGTQWIGTGYYIRCLLPWLLVMLSTNSLMFVSNIFSTQRYDFLFQVVLFVLRLAALYIGIRRGDFRMAVLLFSAVSTVVSLVQLLWYLLQVRRHDKSLL